MDLTTSNSQRRNRLAAIAVAAVLAVAVGVPAWTLSRADANVVDRDRGGVPVLVTRPAPTVAPDAPADPIRLVAGSTVESSELIASELGTLRVDRGDNKVEIENAIMSSPNGQSAAKVGGMAEAFGFDPSYEALVVGDAGQVAFAEPLGKGRNIYNPGGRANSSIVVVDAGTPPGSVKSYDFDANIVPEVFTADGTGLFVIDHQPALNPTSYRIRLLDLGTGELSDVGLPGDDSVSGSRVKLLSPQAMQGAGGRSVATNAGDYLLTLYNRQPSHENGVVHPGHAHGFIHALSLTGEWAVCIDLPPGFGQGDRDSTAITVDPGDQRLYVVDSVVGAAVAYDLADLAGDALLDKGLPRPVALEDLSLDPKGAVTATATLDTLWVAQGTGLRAMSLDLETVKATYSTEAVVEALVTDEAGRSFALVAGRLVSLPSS